MSTRIPRLIQKAGLPRPVNDLVLDINRALAQADALIPENSYLILNERTSDPDAPSEGQWVIWMSDGTGAGDDGDIMVKIKAGGVTKTTTLIDFSALP